MENNKERMCDKIGISLLVIILLLDLFILKSDFVFVIISYVMISGFFFLKAEEKMSRKGKIIRSVINLILICIIPGFFILAKCNGHTNNIFNIELGILNICQEGLILTSVGLLVIGAKKAIFRKKIDKYIVLNIIICLCVAGVIYSFVTFARNNKELFVVVKQNNLPVVEENNSSRIYCVDKPIIYLYPKEVEEISVKLGNSDILTCTYPKYNNEWRVFAYPNGNLVDFKTNRNLYALYWEGKSNGEYNLTEGFLVKGNL